MADIRDHGPSALQPLTSSLSRPGGLLIRRLQFPPGRLFRGIVLGGSQGVALSDDGSVALCQAIYEGGSTDSLDALVLTWDLEALDEPKQLRPPHSTGHVAMTGDGSVAAFAAGPWDLDLVDLRSGDLLGQTRINLNPTAVAVVGVPPRVIVGHDDGTLGSWQAGEDAPLTAKAFTGESVRALDVPRHGRWALVMSNYGTLVRVPLPDLRPVEVLGRHSGAFDAAVDPNGRFAVTGGHDGRLCVWDPEGRSARPVFTSPQHEARIYHISAVENDRAVVELDDGTIHVWDVAERTVLASGGFEVASQGLAVSRDGTTALLRMSGTQVLALDLTALGAQDGGEGGAPTVVAVTPDASVAFVGSRRGVLTRYAISSTPGSHRVCERIALAQTTDGRTLRITGEWCGAVPILDAEQQPATPRSWGSPWLGIVAVAISPDGTWLAWSSTHGGLTVWRLAGGAPKSASWRVGPARALAVDHHGVAVEVLSDGDVHCADAPSDRWWKWDHRSGHLLGRVSAAAAPDCELRALGTRDGVVALERRDGSVSEAQAHTKTVSALAVVGDARAVVSGATDGTLALWQPHVKGGLRTTVAAVGELQCVAISPDGRVAASACDDHLRIWGLPELAAIGEFRCDGEIDDIALARDAELVVVADRAGAIHLLRR